jgi:hypothetical protein
MFVNPPMYSTHSWMNWTGTIWPKNVVKCTKCVIKNKKLLLWSRVHSFIADLPGCAMPHPKRWLCACDLVYLHKLYVCNQCFWLRGINVGSATGGDNKEGIRRRNWCWSCVHKSKNVARYWVMDSVHSMQELNTNRRDCLCMYVCTYICTYVCTYVYILYMYVHMYVYLCVCVCMCVRACVCAYVWVDGCVWVCMYLKPFTCFIRRIWCIWR